MRDCLTADRTYAVGVDFPTPAAAYAGVRDAMDLCGHRVTVQVPSGAWGEALIVGPLTGQARAEDFTFTGIGGPLNCAAPGFYCAEEARFAVRDMTLKSGLTVEAGTLKAGGVWFDTMARCVDTCGARARFVGIGPLTFLFRYFGAAFTAEDHSQIELPCELIISGAPNFSGAFAQADLGGMIDATGARVSPGAATGRRFAAYTGGIVFTGTTGGHPDFFPGNQPGDLNGGIYQ